MKEKKIKECKNSNEKIEEKVIPIKKYERILIAFGLIICAALIIYNIVSSPALASPIISYDIASSPVLESPIVSYDIGYSSLIDIGESSSTLQSHTSEYNSEAQTQSTSSKIQSKPQESSQSTQSKSSLININTATKSELMSLPGIGEVKAASIITYRNNYGPFLSIEDIINVSGVGEKTLEKIINLIEI